MTWGNGSVTFKVEIRNLQDANRFLRGGRDKTKRKIAHETWVEAGTLGVGPDGNYSYVGLRHYSTTILVWVAGGIVINSNVCSNTTMARLNRFLPPGVLAFRRDSQLCYRWRDLDGGSWEAPYEGPVQFSTAPIEEISSMAPSATRYRGRVHTFMHYPRTTDNLQIFLRDLPSVRRTKKK